MRPSRTQVFGIDVDVVSFDDAVYYVPVYAAHRPVSKHISQHKYHEPPLHKLVEKVGQVYPNGSMVHAGTFFGDMVPSFARKIGGRLYAFEPVLENYLLAKSATEVNGLENVLLYHAGLGPEPGTAKVQTGDDTQHAGGGSRVNTGEIPEQMHRQTISILSIDQFAIDNLAMIQLDVEGFEAQVLDGAKNSLARHHPVVVVEDFRKACEPLLAGLGYTDYGTAGPRNTLYLTEERARELGYD